MRRRTSITTTVLLFPVAVWLTVLVVIPTGLMVAYSFCGHDDDTGQPVWAFSLENYKAIFDPAGNGVLISSLIWAGGGGAVGASVGLINRRPLWMLRVGFVLGLVGRMWYGVDHLPQDTGDGIKLFWRSIGVAGITTLLCLVIGYPVAFFLGRTRRPWRDRLLALVMIPFWTSFLLRTFAWVAILRQNGLLNRSLTWLHLTGLIPASGSLLYTNTAIVIGLVSAYLPFMILPIYSSVEKLDGSLIEAALDLGSKPLGVIGRVVLPLTMPGIRAGVMLVFVPAIGMFAVSGLLGGDTTELIGDVIQRQFIGTDKPAGAAYGCVLVLLFGVVFLLGGSTEKVSSQ